MAKGKRFPLLYFVSLLTLAVMLLWISYYYYQSTTGACSKLFSDTLAREQVQAFWREGKITVLMQSMSVCEDNSTGCRESRAKQLAMVRTAGMGMKALFPEQFALLIGETVSQQDLARQVFGAEAGMVRGLSSDCNTRVQQMLELPHQGNRLLVVDSVCLNGLLGAGRNRLIPFEADAEEDAGLMVFVRNAPPQGAPKVLACAALDGWQGR